MPAQHPVRPHQEPDAAEQVAREAVRQGGQECTVASREAWPGRAELPLQDRDLVAQDLDILVPVAYR